MSGGHFNFDQYRIGYIADEIEELIIDNDNKELDQWGYPLGRDYTEDTIKKFKETLVSLRKAQVMVHRIDWLVSGDDGEDTFHERWDKDLEKLSFHNNQ